MTTSDPGSYSPDPLATDAPAASKSTQGSGATQSSTDAKEKVKHAAGTASEETKRVTDTAMGEAQEVAQEVKSQVQGLLREATTQVDDQARIQRDRLVRTLTSLGDDLERMSSQADHGLASQLAREAASRAQALSSRLDGREPSDLLEEVRDFARRRTGAFLLGSLAAGVLAGRLARGAKAASSGSGDVSGKPAASVPPATSATTSSASSAAAYESVLPPTEPGVSGTTPITGTTGTSSLESPGAQP